MKFRRILLPMDFSAHARSAGGVAANLAEELGARVLVLTVLDVGDLRVALKARLHGFRTSVEVRRAVEDWIEKQYETIVMPAKVDWTYSVRRGIAAKEILAEIRSWRPDLVVMGSSGLARRLPLGSSTAEIMRRSRVPVVVCRT